MTLEAKREAHIPDHAEKVEHTEINVALYLYNREIKGTMRPVVVAFSGRRTKPDMRYYYPDEDARAKAIEHYLGSKRKEVEWKEAIKAEEKGHVTSLKEGDILTSCWGYEQTNVDAYQVVDVRGKRTVVLRPIALETVRIEHDMAKHVKPVKDSFTAEGTIRVRVCKRDSAKINSFARASLWNGKPLIQTSYH